MIYVSTNFLTDILIVNFLMYYVYFYSGLVDFAVYLKQPSNSIYQTSLCVVI